MSKLKLTARVIARLPAPDPSGNQKLYWDSELKGFGLLVSGKTTNKTFVVQRDLRGGRTRRVTIGATNVLTLDAARERAQEVLADFFRGIDPKSKRGEYTVRSALEAYLALRTDLRPRTIAGYRGAIETFLASWLDRPLRDISRENVEERLIAIANEVKRNGNGNGGAASANGTMRALRVIYNFASDRAPPNNPMPANPVKLRKQWLPVAARTGHVAEEQLSEFYRAVLELPSAVARDYLLLILFTGFRRNEAAALTWEEVDFKAKVIRLPAARAKGGRKLDLPMSDYVHDLLVARRSIGDASWVFPANSKSGHIEEPKFHLQLIEDATGIHVSVHDLRRTFITIAESTDMSVLALKALVNHSLGKDVTEGYIQMTAERLRAPAQRVADRMKALIAKN